MRLGGEIKCLVCDSPLVIVVESVRGAFSGQIPWHMVFLFNVTAQVSPCKRTKKGNRALFIETEVQNFKTKVQFLHRGQNPNPFECHFHSFFSVG